MTLPTHFVAGLIIGKITGNYSVAVASSVLPDVDHLYSYIKNGVIKNPKKFWKVITSREDKYGDQRNYLHNVLILSFVSLILYFLISKYFFIPFVLGLFSHVLLDLLDSSDYWPFFPNKKINIKGLIKYASFSELVFALVLLLIFFII
jgi:membrane-bound metal-dependent hydrolase YbcI (DUF457 family)